MILRCCLALGLLLFATLRDAAVSNEYEAVAYQQLAVSPTASWTFRIALWRDPDLSQQAAAKQADSLKEKISLIAVRFAEAFGVDLAHAGYGDLTISLIEDYDALRDARLKGDMFQILHCDPALYCLGRNFLRANSEEDPYAPLLEEASSEASLQKEAAVWVRADSDIKSIAQLDHRHIALVNRYSLMGGAVQKAELERLPDRKLIESLNEGAGNYKATVCGSVSDALYRLVTGLATDLPIDAAFLPCEAPGFMLAAREMGLKSPLDLPFKKLAVFKTPSLPGFLLLKERSVMTDASLQERLASFFLAERKSPYRWKPLDDARMKGLFETLQPSEASSMVFPP